MGSEPQPPLEARRATAADLDAAAETLAQAFHEDPVWAWAFPDPERRLEQHRAAWSFPLRAALEYGWLWLAGDADAVAVWIPPSRPETRPEDEPLLEPTIKELTGERAPLVLETYERFDAAHPEGPPHYYLSLLGTHPRHRGRGIGMSLLADGLARIDTGGMPAFLESSNPANTPRYERLGFRPRGEFDLPEDGPVVTQMWREPQGGPEPAPR